MTRNAAVKSASCLTGIFIVLLVGALGCKETPVNITEMEDLRVLRSACIETTVPLFFGRIVPPISFSDVRGQSLRPPGAAYVPFSIGDFVADPGVATEFEVRAIFPTGTRLRITEVWRLMAYEGDSLAVIGTGYLPDQAPFKADVSQLMTLRWNALLSDGQLSPWEASELNGVPILRPELARFCDEPSVGTQGQLFQP